MKLLWIMMPYPLYSLRCPSSAKGTRFDVILPLGFSGDNMFRMCFICATELYRPQNLRKTPEILSLPALCVAYGRELRL